jgi:hypothetical protein
VERKSSSGRTRRQSQPVALANVQRVVGERKLTLLRTIQPYYRAAIYARVSGYLKSW